MIESLMPRAVTTVERAQVPKEHEEEDECHEKEEALKQYSCNCEGGSWHGVSPFRIATLVAKLGSNTHLLDN